MELAFFIHQHYIQSQKDFRLEIYGVFLTILGKNLSQKIYNFILLDIKDLQQHKTAVIKIESLTKLIFYTAWELSNATKKPNVDKVNTFD